MQFYYDILVIIARDEIINRNREYDARIRYGV